MKQHLMFAPQKNPHNADADGGRAYSSTILVSHPPVQQQQDNGTSSSSRAASPAATKTSTSPHNCFCPAEGTPTTPQQDNLLQHDLILLGMEIALGECNVPAHRTIAHDVCRTPTSQVENTVVPNKNSTPTVDLTGMAEHKDVQCSFHEKTEKDVIFGRGGATFAHNTFFRNHVYLYRHVYSTIRGRSAKQKVIHDLYDWVHANGGRFLQRSNAKKKKGTGLWYQASRISAFEKIQQMFRDASKKDYNLQTPFRDLNDAAAAQERQENLLGSDKADSESAKCKPSAYYAFGWPDRLHACTP